LANIFFSFQKFIPYYEEELRKFQISQAFMNEIETSRKWNNLVHEYTDCCMKTAFDYACVCLIQRQIKKWPVRLTEAELLELKETCKCKANESMKDLMADGENRWRAEEQEKKELREFKMKYLKKEDAWEAEERDLNLEIAALKARLKNAEGGEEDSSTEEEVEDVSRKDDKRNRRSSEGKGRKTKKQKISVEAVAGCSGIVQQRRKTKKQLAKVEEEKQKEKVKELKKLVERRGVEQDLELSSDSD